MRTLKNFINGEWRDSKGGRAKDVNPADVDDVIAEAPLSTAAEAAEACEAAARAFVKWRSTPAPVRGQILYKVQRRMLATARSQSRTSERLTRLLLP